MIDLNFARCASIAGAALLLMGTACGSVETPSGGGGQGGTTSSSSTTTTTTTTTTGSGGAGGATCGGIAGTPCAADEWCDFGDNRCGGNDDGGVCVKRPVGCEKNLLPTCGCDNQIHDNECDAHKAGVDVNDSGFCKAPAGMFACGAHFCTLGSYYCQMTGSDVGGTPDSFQCAALPAGCGPMPTCACLDPGSCGGTCSATPDGGLQIVCPGG